MDLSIHSPGLFILLLSAVFLEGLKIEVKKQVNVPVKAGEEAHLQCPLKHSSDVLQVMWQKILPEEKVTVATCLASRRKFNPKFSKRVGINGTGVQNCILVLQNVTAQDEGCYLCLFITSSEVAHTGKVCLQVHELHGPVLNVTESTSTGELVVSCSATGRPAPDVTLHVPQKHRTLNSSVTNSNGTVTVTSTAVLSHLKETQEYHCSVSSPFEKKQVVNIIVPDTKSMQYIVSGLNTMDSGFIVALTIGLCCACVGVITVLLLIKKYRKSRVLREKKNVEKGDDVKTPLKIHIKQENGSTHRRTPGSKERQHSKPLLSSKRLFK